MAEVVIEARQIWQYRHKDNRKALYRVRKIFTKRTKVERFNLRARHFWVEKRDVTFVEYYCIRDKENQISGETSVVTLNNFLDIVQGEGWELLVNLERAWKRTWDRTKALKNGWTRGRKRINFPEVWHKGLKKVKRNG